MIQRFAYVNTTDDAGLVLIAQGNPVDGGSWVDGVDPMRIVGVPDEATQYVWVDALDKVLDPIGYVASSYAISHDSTGFFVEVHRAWAR